IARRAGVAGEAIFFSGPGKTARELERALEQGLGAINVESGAEAARLDELARKRGLGGVPICLRINPKARKPGAGIVMGGRSTQFGVDEEEAADCLQAIEKLASLRLKGLHLFSGSQILDAEVSASTIASAIDLGLLYEGAVGRAPEILHVGPGLGVPLDADDAPVDMAVFRERVAAA